MSLDKNSLHALARRALNGNGEVRAFQVRGEWLDWAWLRRTADRIEDMLVETGIAPGVAIGFAPLNRPEFCAALLGLIAARRDVMMIYAFQSAEAFGRRLAELGCAAVIAPPELWDASSRAAATDAGTLGISLSGEDLSIMSPYAPSASRRTERGEDETGIALLSSGTTGPPKPIHIEYHRLEKALVSESYIDTVEGGLPQLHYFPLSNIGGLYYYIPLALQRRPIILLEKFSVAGWADYVGRWRPDHAVLPPAGFRMVLDADVPRDTLSSLNYIVTGSARVDPAVHRAFEAHYGVPILLSYGATEFGGVVAAMTPEDLTRYGDAKFGSVGRAWAEAKLRIVDPETGDPAPPGVDGRLEVLSPRMGPDWFRTTDIAAIDEEGFMFHKGRSDGAITRGGFKILPEVVTAAMTEHPAIAAAAVIGIADARLGEAPVAAYELRPGSAEPSPAELSGFLRDRLPSTHLPIDYLRFDALPRTPSLKLDLGTLRKLLAARMATDR